ncbi:hypothetical protein EX30DRAFT_332139 [Ascodesmis nigricans]|uniref:Methyltransferase domain-containing protein n=1 Tax=Ascodesmis nigricans TaxID=341454 RepID=A0A4S2MVK1_9PEZI|nr:hypothetical protein EX30DRAFT_332139 [Ascodesmis nigricans]
MPPSQPLPYDTSRFSSPEEYVDSLLEFSRNPLLRLLCGGVHILDFFTKDRKDGASDDEPEDLYSAVLPEPWRAYLGKLEMDEVLELLLRTPVDQFSADVPDDLQWYIKEVRDHSLRREFARVEESKRAMKETRPGTERALYAGMKPKKVHEVEHFAAFVDDLVHSIPDPPISQILDYGSGQAYLSRTLAKKYSHNVLGLESRPNNIQVSLELDRRYDHLYAKSLLRSPSPTSTTPTGALTYLQTHITASSPLPPLDSENLLLISLHSCGNLLHHALHAFSTTPTVRAVALIGCCHNLLTERHGRTSKIPPSIHHPALTLRSPHPRVEALAAAADPSGFPISQRFFAENITLNITARSMAVQAPGNWTRDASAGFFRRHYYRALLQRVVCDLGIVDMSMPAVTIGSLRKRDYESFESYTVAAAVKMGWRLDDAVEKLGGGAASSTTSSKSYDILWSLMAFSASIVESLIVVDRWVFLGEVESVKERWVEVVFEYGESPRNLVVVGVR